MVHDTIVIDLIRKMALQRFNFPQIIDVNEVNYNVRIFSGSYQMRIEKISHQNAYLVVIAVRFV